MIEPAALEDWAWIKPVFAENPKTFGNYGLAWWRFWNARSGQEHWDVIRPSAFVHWRLRRDGIRVIDEIAVAASAQRSGYGRILMEHVGRPIRLKTDDDNAGSNAFYERMGLLLTAKTKTRAGKAQNIYYAG